MNLFGPGSNKISIQLDSEYFSVGDDITGTLILDVHSKVNLLTLQVFVFGKEKIWMMIGQGDNRRHEKRVINFLEETCYIIGEPVGPKKKKPEKTVIPPGHYEYKFSCPVPEDCPLPPSIEVGKSGIYYGIWGHIEDSSTWGANKGKTKKRKKSSQVKECFVPFHMVGKFLPEVPTPKKVNFTMIKKFVLASKALEMNVKMMRDVWEAGETIKILLSMKNETSKEVKRVETMIMPHWYQQLSKSKEFNQRMPQMFEVKWPDSGCPAGDTKIFKFDLVLGEEIYPSIETAEIFRYHHVVMLRVFVKGESFIEIGLPITIQCSTTTHNYCELEPATEFPAEDPAVFGTPEETSNSGSCCVIL